jgi:hypothetical protein
MQVSQFVVRQSKNNPIVVAEYVGPEYPKKTYNRHVMNKVDIIN